VSGVAPGAVVAAESWSNASESGLTNDGHLVGTPRYIAPELAAGHVMLSPASDVFSFGILAYEVLSGARPFAEPPVKRRARGLPLSPPVPLAAQNPDVPEALGRLIDRCLLEAVGERPTAAELARALAAEPALAAPAGEEPARHLAH
jgi:serine/threonine-protein kinase